MRRATAVALAIALLLAAPTPTPVHAKPTQSGGPPQAWLFGAWTGGLFPPPATLTAQSCLAQPTVIFTRDVVMRASLIAPSYSQRVVETARTSAGGTDFQFSPAVDPTAAMGSGLMGVTAPPAAAGFGCETPNVLHVQRRGENEIAFPGCADFPEPLVRCPAR
jgi:hypothetical protein